MMHAGMSLLMSAPAVLFQTLLVAAASGYIILGRLPSLSGRSAKSRIKFLLVTAHPDDECMFFGPALTNLLSSGEEVHLLCLSEGESHAVRETCLWISLIGPSHHSVLKTICRLRD